MNKEYKNIKRYGHIKTGRTIQFIREGQESARVLNKRSENGNPIYIRKELIEDSKDRNLVNPSNVCLGCGYEGDDRHNGQDCPKCYAFNWSEHILINPSK